MAELAYSFLKGNAVCKKRTQLFIHFKPLDTRSGNVKASFFGTGLATDYLSVPHRDMKNQENRHPLTDA